MQATPRPRYASQSLAVQIDRSAVRLHRLIRISQLDEAVTQMAERRTILAAASASREPEPPEPGRNAPPSHRLRPAPAERSDPAHPASTISDRHRSPARSPSGLHKRGPARAATLPRVIRDLLTIGLRPGVLACLHAGTGSPRQGIEAVRVQFHGPGVRVGRLRVLVQLLVRPGQIQLVLERPGVQFGRLSERGQGLLMLSEFPACLAQFRHTPG